MLLCDFHVHSTWSDGKLGIPEIVDLFGAAGHDAIAITDHVVNSDSLLGKAARRFGLTVTPETFPSYREEIAREARRAWDSYRMVVLAGVELSRNAVTRNASAHALALGLDTFVSADGTPEEMLGAARAAGAITVACHPHEQSDWFSNTFYLWNRRQELAPLVDLWELACRWDLFPPVARARLPFLGNSDFHDRPHIWAWKTLVDAPKNEKAIFAALRKGTGLGVTRLVPRFEVEASAEVLALPARLAPTAA